MLCAIAKMVKNMMRLQCSILQKTVEVSAALLELITKLVPAVIVPIDKCPCVPPAA